MRQSYPKGTQVRIRTDNGGEISGALLEKYVPTYAAVIAVGKDGKGYAVIQGWRIVSVEQVRS